jgi:hypothetical protein
MTQVPFVAPAEPAKPGEPMSASAQPGGSAAIAGSRHPSRSARAVIALPVMEDLHSHC